VSKKSATFVANFKITLKFGALFYAVQDRGAARKTAV